MNIAKVLAHLGKAEDVWASLSMIGLAGGDAAQNWLKAYLTIEP